MLWDWNHSEVRGFFWWFLSWHLKIGWDHVGFTFSFESFLHDNSVHSPSKILVDFVHDTGGVNVLSRLEVSRGGGHVDNSTDLLRIELRQFFSWHIVDEEVVSDDGISIDSLLMSLSDSLGKDSWILGVKKQVNSGKLYVLHSHIPLTAVDSSLLIPRFDENCFPFADSFIVFDEALSWYWCEVALFISSELNPLVWKSAVVFEIIEWLKWKPLSSMLLVGAGSVVDAQLHKQLLDVKGSKQLPLSIDYDLSRRLAWNRKEWFHDFWIWISHTFSLFGVKALIHVGVSEIVLTNDLDILLQGGQVFLYLLDWFSLLLFQTFGSWDLLFLVCLNQTGALWADGRNKL